MFWCGQCLKYSSALVVLVPFDIQPSELMSEQRVFAVALQEVQDSFTRKMF